MKQGLSTLSSPVAPGNHPPTFYLHDWTTLVKLNFSLSCIGEGNGKPLQYSFLENAMDGGAWWAAVHGVAKGRTHMHPLSETLGKQAGRAG